MEFLGYPRPDGSVGIRNYVCILPGGLIPSKICDFVRGTKTIVTPHDGLAFTPRDRETLARLLIGLGKNPNVAAVIVNNYSPGSTYAELNSEHLATEIGKSGKPVEIIDFGTDSGPMQTMTQGIRIAREMVREASSIRREPFGLDKLSIGVKCGASDATSGIAGNPVMGYLCDRVVEAGGTAVFGETTEIIGAEHLLVKRATNDETAKKMIAAVNSVEERVRAVGVDIRTINPAPGNISAGISTLEEKSLGAIHKAGHLPIAGFLEYAEESHGKGLFFMNSSGSHSSTLPGFAASGAQLTLFQLGGGTLSRSLLNSSWPVVAPVLWATANSITYRRCIDGIDFFSGPVIEGKETIEDAGERLLSLVMDIASGTLARGETINYAEPLQVHMLDPVF